MEQPKTLSEVLRPFATSYLSERTGIRAKQISRWRNGNAIPPAPVLPALADAIRMDLGELTRIVAQQAA